MIALISQVIGEGTTELVMDWLRYLGADVVRVNGEQLNSEDALELRIGTEAGAVRIDAGDRPVSHRNVRTVWQRRWHTLENLSDLQRNDASGLGHKVLGHLARELVALRRGMEDGLRSASWLTRGRDTDLDKLRVLRLATDVGLDVPPTLVTNRRATLEAFLAEQGRIICKPLGEADSFQVGDASYAMFTAEVTPQVLARLPERFFPSLFQARIEKRYELRVFYLAGRCWAMAIFSQGDAKTQADFRNYNWSRPNRCVPFSLPPVLEGRLRDLMTRLQLDTGSIDLIRTDDGRYVFLEINPVGQFGMVSLPCNYFLERRVAEHLMEMHDAA